MASIAKNIKRLRGERGLTQEQLAEQLCVTRQTVSSWENNRTQPDIDMLTALSAALDADIEELIYGKRRSVGLEAPADDRAAAKRLSGVVLAVFGSLLLAAGCIILIVWLWRDMPELTRRILSFLPAAAGMGFALWAVFGKKHSRLVSEAAAVVWIAGFCASVALVNHTFGVDFGFSRLLLADTLLILPVMFALDSVAGFTALNGFGIAFLFRFGEEGRLPMLAFTALFFAAAALFVKKNGLPAELKVFARWVLTGAGVTYLTGLVGFLAPDYGYQSALLILLACFAALLAADRETDGALPLRYPAAAGVVILSFVNMLMLSFYYEGINSTQKHRLAQILPWVYGLAAVIVAAGVVYGRKSFKNNPLKILFLVLSVAQMGLMLTYQQWPKALAIAALGVVLILRGVKTLKLLPLNFGMLTVAMDLIFVIQELLEDNMPLIGGFCAALGVAILLINRKMLSVKKEKEAAKEAENDA